MSGSTRYDIVQTTFLLSMASNGASDIFATQAELQTYLTTALNGGTDPIGTQFAGFFPSMNPRLAGGDWSVAWGPCVYSTKPDQDAFAANAMYVAHSPSLAAYVVAIAATNPKSLYDWVQEDGDVNASYMAAWPVAMPFMRSWHLPWLINPPPAISAATALGISNLLTQMRDPDKGSLQGFLTHAANSSQTLIFCGHSLAGALSPSLALHLYPQPQASGWKQVLVLPTAGASPGNTKFAGLFVGSNAYPPVAVPGVGAPYGVWNTDYANANDIVPHAWNQLDAVVSGKDAAGNVVTIYGVMDPTMGDAVTAAVDAAKLLATGGYYQNLTQTKFPPNWGHWVWTQNQDGSWQYPPVWQSMTPYTDANPVRTVDELGGLILATHIDQYYPFFGVVPGPRMPTSTPAGAAQNALQKALLAAAKVSA